MDMKKKLTRKRKAAPVAVVIDRVEVYQDVSGDWRWHAKAGNNKIVAESGEGYRNLSYAQEMARALYPSTRIDIV